MTRRTNHFHDYIFEMYSIKMNDIQTKYLY